jgi:hypothetical protein
VQMNVRGKGDEELMVSVLSFARERSAEVLAAVPFAVLEGYKPPADSDYQFDTVGGVNPAVYRIHDKIPELAEVTYKVFPAWRCEFSGRETQLEARDRFKKFLGAADIHRLPTPFLKLRFDNPKTGGGTIGPDLGLASADLLFRELRELDRAEGAWIDFQNFENKLRRAYWHDGPWLAAEGGQGREIELTDLLSYAHTFLFEGVDDADPVAGSDADHVAGSGAVPRRAGPAMSLALEDRNPIHGVTEADIRAGVARLNSRGPRFAVLSIRPHCYIQTYALDDGRLDVDYREGGPDRAYVSPLPQSKDAVTDAFLSYLNDDDRWRTAFDWERQPEEDL